MTKISKALSPEKVSTYYKRDLGALSGERNYYAQGVGPGESGEWFGRKAETFGLVGKPVDEATITRLAIGQDPNTGEQLIKWRPAAKTPEPEWIRSDSAWSTRLEELFGAAVVDGRSSLERQGTTSSKIIRQPITNTPAAPEPIRTPREAALYAIHAETRAIYAANLAGENGQAARAYLTKQRGYSAKTIEEFGLGIAEPSGKELAEQLRHFGPKLMIESGIFVRSYDGQLVDRFRGRVTIPIQNERGEVVAFAARPLETKEGDGLTITGQLDSRTNLKKYLNSPETEIYHKRETVFNLHRAKERAHEGGRMVVQEGYFDAIATYQAGVRNVVTLGGIAVTDEHIQKLKPHANAIVLNLDGDKPGREAAERNIPKLMNAGFHVRNLSLPAGAGDKMDPDKWIKEHGAEAYRKELRHVEPLVDYFATEARAKFNLTPPPGERVDPQSKAAAMRWIMDSLKHVQPEQRAAISKDLESFLKHPPEQKLEKEPTQHRAAWDMTIGAPKSVSLTAIHDPRVRLAHDAAAKEAFGYIERSIQVKMGGLNAPQTTGQMVAALFQHDTARPVDGYAAPHLHTHGVIFNMSTDENGQTRALNPKELFYIQSAAEAVYQNRLALDLHRYGYELGYGKNASIEIAGYSDEYLKAESPRTTEIEEEKARLGKFGQEANSNAALNTRAPKSDDSPEVVRAAHIEHAEKFGNQHEQILAHARERGPILYSEEIRAEKSDEAIAFAKGRLGERTTVMEDFEIHRDALKHGRGYITLSDVEQAFKRAQSQFVRVQHWRTDAPNNRWTTPEMIAKERKILNFMAAGRDLPDRRSGFGPISGGDITKDQFREKYKKHLNENQKKLVWDLINTQDRMVGVQGLAGTGKTHALDTVRFFAERYGYEVRGLAATSPAVKEMLEAGVDATTIQSFLTNKPKDQKAQRVRYYLVDESSLADVHSIASLIERLNPLDRITFVGDKQQLQSLGAGKVFEELQDAGMTTFKLSKIVRQIPEDYREVVQNLAHGKVVQALEMLEDHGRIHSVPHQGDRYHAIAQVVASTEAGMRTLVVSPDNRSRLDISEAIRAEKQAKDLMGQNIYKTRILNQRGDLTETDLTFALSYQTGDVVHYRRDSAVGMKKEDYASVVKVEREGNMLTVMRESDGAIFSYNPRRTATEAEVYEPTSREFAVGERVMFTKTWKEPGTPVIKAANRQLGTIEALDESGNVKVKLDTPPDKPEKTISWKLEEMPHLDYGYVMTAYSAQGTTVDRVIVHIDTDAPNVQQLLSQQLAYVAASRGKQDVHLFVNDQEELDDYLSRRPENPTALDRDEIASYVRT
jgi:DNA primase catalytic core